MTHQPLSIFIICRNEADRIGRTLAAVSGIADEIVVIDSGSEDDTQDVARAAGARVLVQPFLGYGPQKRFAEEHCRNDWLLNLDADEVVPPALAAEIATALTRDPERFDAFTIPIAEVFPGEAAPHPLAYTLKPVRLYRKSKGRYVDSIVHDRVAMAPAARIGRLKTPIHHFSVRSIGDQIAKLNVYTDQQVRDLALGGKQVSSWRLLGEFPLSFLKAYLLRRHVLRGRYGFITAMNFAFYRWLRIAKDFERRHVQRATEHKENARDGK